MRDDGYGPDPTDRPDRIDLFVWVLVVATVIFLLFQFVRWSYTPDKPTCLHHRTETCGTGVPPNSLPAQSQPLG